MARGRGKQRGGGRDSRSKRGGKQNNKKYNLNKFKQKSDNKRDASHLREFGEAHPSEDADRKYGPADKRRRVDEKSYQNKAKSAVSSDEDSVEDKPHDHFKQLLSIFSGVDKNKPKAAIDSDESDDLESDTGSDEQGEPESGVGLGQTLDVEEDVSDHDDEGSEHGSNDSPQSDSESDSGRRQDTLKVKDSEEETEEDLIQHDAPDENLDPFVRHFQYDMDEALYDSVSKVPPNTETLQQSWPTLGQLTFCLPKPDSAKLSSCKPVSKMSIVEEKTFAEPGSIPNRITDVDLNKLYIKSQIQDNVFKANALHLNSDKLDTDTGIASADGQFTPLQKELFSIINNYQDVYYPLRTLQNGEEVRFVYCLHAVNHILKTRNKIIHHNARLSKKDEVPEDYRDQGLVRPKIVILVPFRDSALKVVNMIVRILFKAGSANVVNMKRFVDEHTGDEIAMPRRNPRPEDYEATFAGNTDDTFRIGLTLTKKSLKLYADFYSADIIVASPLGLRVIVGAEGEAERDFDFLASVELLVLDQTELFLMQNWDHLLHVLDHFHLQPKQSHGTDFARVRSWALGGWARYYRQTLVFSGLALPQISALCNKKCSNYAGAARVVNPVVAGAICQVAVQLPQVFHRFEAGSAADSIDARFSAFVKTILPQFRDADTSHVMIFVPSYFDFVRLRNHLKREDVGFVQICEYSKDGKIARARDMFYHDDAHFLLYSERFHFFRRLRIKGIRHLVFYQPPTFPHLYAEMCNLMQPANQNRHVGSATNTTVTVLYSRYDVQQLAALVGTDRARRMVTSERSVHMFATGQT